MSFFNHKHFKRILIAVALGCGTVLLSFLNVASQANDEAVITRADVFSVIEKVKHNKNLNNLKKCPGDYAAEKPILFPSNDHIYQYCVADLPNCYQRCSRNQPYACYFLAQALQTNGAIFEAEQLFQRSCELGVASGCTNRAAGMKTLLSTVSTEQQACFSRTFKKSCDWKDPWGCTMYAYELVDSLGTVKAEQKVLRVLEGSCKHGKDDPACEAAETLKEDIKKYAKAP